VGVRIGFSMILRKVGVLLLIPGLLIAFCGCGTIRVTDPAETADQQFLESEATRQAVRSISMTQLRDRKVFVDTTYLSTVKENSESLSFRQVPQQYLFLVAELRAKLLLSGARLMDKKEDAEIIVEARTGGIGVNHYELLFGLGSITIPTEGVANIPFQTPELAILKTTKQFGYASVAVVAYWRDTGEIVGDSGPFVGRTDRGDFWIFGVGPRTDGNIPTTETPAPTTAGK
jgi:hypothetical protein